MQKTISAIAVVTGLLTGTNAQSGHQIVIDSSQMEQSITKTSDLSNEINPLTVLPEAVAAGAVSQTSFTSDDRAGITFHVEGTYLIQDAVTQPELHILMDEEHCSINGASSATVGDGRYTVTALGTNIGVPDGSTCEIKIMEAVQNSNSFGISLTQDVPGLTLKGTPTEDEIADGVSVLPSTVAAGQNYYTTFKSATMDPGTFNIAGTYAINDGGNDSGNSVVIGMNYQESGVGACTVSKSSIFSGIGYYAVTAKGENLNQPHAAKCTISFSAVEQSANTFTIQLLNMPGEVTLQSGATYSGVIESVTLPASISPNSSGEMRFTGGKDTSPEVGAFDVKGTYAINDGGSTKFTVRSALTTSGSTICTVNDKAEAEFNSSTGSPKKYYVARAVNNKAVPDATECTISVEEVEAPSLTSAVINIKNQ